MTKLTPTQAYAVQAKANRKAAAQERQDPIIKADDIRIREMMAARG